MDFDFGCSVYPHLTRMSNICHLICVIHVLYSVISYCCVECFKFEISHCAHACLNPNYYYLSIITMTNLVINIVRNDVINVVNVWNDKDYFFL